MKLIFLIGVALLSALGGCGTKGALVLPPKPSQMVGQPAPADLNTAREPAR